MDGRVVLQYQLSSVQSTRARQGSVEWWVIFSFVSFHRDSEVSAGDGEQLQQGWFCEDHSREAQIPASYQRPQPL